MVNDDLALMFKYYLDYVFSGIQSSNVFRRKYSLEIKLHCRFVCYLQTVLPLRQKLNRQVSVVQKVNNSIHRINRYQVNGTSIRFAT